MIRLPNNQDYANRSLEDILAGWQEVGRIVPQPAPDSSPPLEGGCMIWGGAVNNFGLPVFRNAKRTYSVRRFVLSKKLGRELEAEEQSRTLCMNQLCIAPNHLEVIQCEPRERPVSFRLPESEWERIKKFRPTHIAWGDSSRWKPEAVRFVVEAGAKALTENPEEVMPPKAYFSENYEIRLPEEFYQSIRKLRSRPSERDSRLIRRIIAAGLKALESQQ